MSQVTVDDMAPSVIHTGTWRAGGSAREFSGTVSSTTVPGGTLSLTFTGSSVAVYGTIDSLSAGAVSTYTLDGNPPVPFVAGPTIGDTYDQKFWDSGPISDGQHTLVVTMTKVNPSSDPLEGTIWFDYFVYSTSSNTPSSFSSIPPLSSASSSSTSSTSSTSSPAIATAAKSKKISIGAILGGGLVALLVLGFLIAWLIFWWRNKRRNPSKALAFTMESANLNPSTGSRTMLTQQSSNLSPEMTPFSHTPTHATPISHGPSVQTTRVPPSTAPSTISYATNARPYSHTHNVSQATFHSVASSAPGIPAMSTLSSSAHGDNPNPYHPASFGTSQLASSSSTAKRRERLVVLTYDGDDNADAETSIAPSAMVTQHVDSGIRSTDGRTGPVVELPPVYTPN